MTQQANVPRRLALIAVLSLIGAGIGISLTSHFYQIRGGAGGFKSFCNISQAVNCDAVAASRWAEILPGIPLSSFVTGWFLSLFFIALLARSSDWRREGIRGALILTGIASLCSLLFFTVMAAVIHTFCLLCLGVDAVSLVSFGLVLSMRPESFSKAPLDFGKWKVMAGVVAGAVFVAVVALKGMDKLGIDQATIREYADAVLATPPVAVGSGEEFPSIGAGKDAPVTIVEFSDFQCPHCRNGAMILHSVLSRFPGKVRLVHRNLPLDPACNRKMQNAGHPAACETARASFCAMKQGQFGPFYDKVFDDQAKLAPGVPAEFAKELGMDSQKLVECMAAPDAAAAVAKDLEEGERLGVGSTPTYFINGHRVEGPYPLPIWERVIERLLAG